MLDDPQNTSRIKIGGKVGQPSNFHQNPEDMKFRQGVVYSIPCRDCNIRYIGETTRSLETCQKRTQSGRTFFRQMSQHTFDL